MEGGLDEGERCVERSSNGCVCLKSWHGDVLTSAFQTRRWRRFGANEGVAQIRTCPDRGKLFETRFLTRTLPALSPESFSSQLGAFLGYADSEYVVEHVTIGIPPSTLGRIVGSP